MKEKILLFENFALLSFSDFERKRSLVLLQAWLRQASQKFVVHVQTKFFTKKFFESRINFSSFPELQPKVFRILKRKFRQSVHNYFYTCTWEHFEESYVPFAKIHNYFLRRFRNLRCKCVDSQRKFFATVVKIAFSVAKESFLMKEINLFKKL